MIFDILIGSISIFIGISYKVMRFEFVFGIFFHECHLFNELIDKLSPNNIERALGDSMDMLFFAFLTEYISSPGIKQHQERIGTINCGTIHSQNSIQNIKLSNDSLFALFTISMNTTIIHIAFVGYLFILW